MPIKFRCVHCRQFLGISRSRAGHIVDCPSCGRAVRVPELDGRVMPIPKPQVDLQDSKLAKALDELANIAAGNKSEGGTPSGSSVKKKEASKSLAPLPAPEPISVAPPLPPESISVQEEPTRPTAHEHQNETVPHDVQRPVPAIRTEPVTPDLAEDVFPFVVTSSGPKRGLSPSVERSRSWHWQSLVSAPVLILLGCASVVPFVFGYLIGQWVQADRPAAAIHAVSRRQVKSGAPAADSSAEAPAFRGRITYKTELGESQPDRGARVIVFPKERKGVAKLSVVGFRAGDDPADVRLATESMRVIGGDLAITDDDGNFQLSLASAGDYSILVLSPTQRRDGQRPHGAELTSLLDAYFDRWDSLLGQFAYWFSPIRYDGAGTQVWDHSFE